MLPEQQTQMEEPLIHLDSQDFVSHLPFFPRFHLQTVESHQKNFWDWKSLTVVLPNRTNLSNLNPHHWSPTQKTQIRRGSRRIKVKKENIIHKLIWESLSWRPALKLPTLIICMIKEWPTAHEKTKKVKDQKGWPHTTVFPLNGVDINEHHHLAQ